MGPDAALECGMWSRRLDEHVLVLAVARGQRALALLLADDELEPAHARNGRAERHRAVGVRARRDLARVLAEVEQRRVTLLAHRDLAQRAVRVARRELARQ